MFRDWTLFDLDRWISEWTLFDLGYCDSITKLCHKSGVKIIFSRVGTVWSRPVDLRMDAVRSRILQFDCEVLSTIRSQCNFFQIGRCLISTSGFENGRCLISDYAIWSRNDVTNQPSNYLFEIRRCLISSGGFYIGCCLSSGSASWSRNSVKNQKASTASSKSMPSD